MAAIDPVFLGTSKLRRPDAISLDYYDSFSMGPSALGDATLGVQYRPWHVHYDPTLKKVTARRANDANDGWDAWQDVFIHTGVIFEETDSCFDQQGRIFFCGERAGEVWVYYFDSLVSSYVFTNFGEGRTPKAALDNPLDLSNSDVLLLYFKDSTNDLRYRMQRERYLTEHVIAPNAGSSIPSVDTFLEDVYQSRDNRLHILYSVRGGGRYTLNHVESLLYPRFSDIESYTVGMAPVLAGVPVVLFLVGPAGYVDPNGHLPDFLDDIDNHTTAFAAVSGLNYDILIRVSTYDDDAHTAAFTAQSGLVPVVMIFHTLYDVDTHTAAFLPLSGTSIVVMIFYTVYDNDAHTAAMTAQSGVLAP